MARDLEAKGSDEAVSVVKKLLTQEEKLLSKEEALACIEHLTGFVEDSTSRLKPSELLKALAESIDVIHERMRRPDTRPATAMVAWYGPNAWTATMPVIPGPAPTQAPVRSATPAPT